MLKHVLVPLDGSPLAETALDYAIQITAKNGTLHLLAAVADVENFFIPTAGNVKRIDEQLQQARKYLTDIAGRIKKANGIDTAIEARVGDPAATIVEVAQRLNVDAIAMSTHGRSGMSKVIFGSVAQKVLQLTPCPVFIIPGRETVKSEQAAATQRTLRPATQ